MNIIRLNTTAPDGFVKVGNGGGGGADEWIVAIPNQNISEELYDIAAVVQGIGSPAFFPKGSTLQIVDGNGRYLTIITPQDDVSNILKGSHYLCGAAIKKGATMNDILGDGKIRTFNNEEDYKNILLELCQMSGVAVTMADIELAVKFLSQNELMGMMANYEA